MYICRLGCSRILRVGNQLPSIVPHRSSPGEFDRATRHLCHCSFGGSHQVVSVQSPVETYADGSSRWARHLDGWLWLNSTDVGGTPCCQVISLPGTADLETDLGRSVSALASLTCLCGFTSKRVAVTTSAFPSRVSGSSGWCLLVIIPNMVSCPPQKGGFQPTCNKVLIFLPCKNYSNLLIFCCSLSPTTETVRLPTKTNQKAT